MRIVPWRVSAFFTFAVCMSVCAASLQAQTWSAPQLVENGGGAAVSVNANGTAAVIYAGLASVKTNGVWETPVSRPLGLAPGIHWPTKAPARVGRSWR